MYINKPASQGETSRAHQFLAENRRTKLDIIHYQGRVSPTICEYSSGNDSPNNKSVLPHGEFVDQAIWELLATKRVVEVKEPLT